MLRDRRGKLHGSVPKFYILHFIFQHEILRRSVPQDDRAERQAYGRAAYAARRPRFPLQLRLHVPAAAGDGEVGKADAFQRFRYNFPLFADTGRIVRVGGERHLSAAQGKIAG